MVKRKKNRANRKNIQSAKGVSTVKHTDAVDDKDENNTADDTVVAGIFVFIFGVVWVSAGIALWNMVMSSSGNETLAWIAAIVGGFVAAVAFFALGYFFMQA